MENQMEQEVSGTRGEKIFLTVFFGILVTVLIITYLKYFVLKDYYIQTQISCDPEKEACFVYECDPAEDTECSKEPEERFSYYKLIKKKANRIPLCDPNSEDCPELACAKGEDCVITLCDEETRGEDEECNNPAQYLIEMTAEDEEGAEEEENEEGTEKETEEAEECVGDDCAADEDEVDESTGEKTTKEEIISENKVETSE